MTKSISSEQSPEVTKLRKSIRETRRTLARFANAAPTPTQVNRYQEELAELVETYENNERRLAEISEASARNIRLRKAKVQDLVSVLPKGVVVVDFLLSKHSALVESADLKKNQRDTETTNFKVEVCPTFKL